MSKPTETDRPASPKFYLTTPELSAFQIVLPASSAEEKTRELWLPLYDGETEYSHPRHALRSRLARLAATLLGCVALFCFCRDLRQSDLVREWTGVYSDLDPYARLRSWHPDVDVDEAVVDPDSVSTTGRCNPFEELGRLQIDPARIVDTVWEPYDEQCEPSTWMKQLVNFRHSQIRAAESGHFLKTPVELAWLVNRTVLLQGDSTERVQLVKFCHAVGGELELITPDHPASPRMYRKPLEAVLDENADEMEYSRLLRVDRRQKEQDWEARKHGWPESRPYLCDVPDLGFTMVSVAAWTLADHEHELEAVDAFHGPPSWLD